jgi:hypothetical protein
MPAGARDEFNRKGAKSAKRDAKKNSSLRPSFALFAALRLSFLPG